MPGEQYLYDPEIAEFRVGQSQ